MHWKTQKYLGAETENKNIIHNFRHYPQQEVPWNQNYI